MERVTSTEPKVKVKLETPKRTNKRDMIMRGWSHVNKRVKYAIPLIVLSFLLCLLVLYYLTQPGEERLVILCNENFSVTIDKSTGAIKEFFHPKDEFKTNFAGNEENNIHVKINNGSWLGDVTIKYRISSFTSSNVWFGYESATTRWHHVAGKGIRIDSYGDRIIFSYYDEKAGPSGFRDIELKKTYRLDNNDGYFVLELDFINRVNSTIEVGEVSLPMVFNILACPPSGEVENAYEKRVIIHPFIAGHSSYIYLTRLNGEPPYLLVIPGNGTAFEAFTGHWSLGVIFDPTPVLYLYSKANTHRLAWDTWFNGLRSFYLAPGETKKLSFKFYWVNSYEEINEKLYRLGKVAVKIALGMVIPEDLEASVLLRCKKPINKIEIDEETEIVGERRTGENVFLRLKFNGLGQHVLKIHYGKGEWVSLPFYSIKNIEELMNARSRFIITKQRITDPNDIRQYAFLMWDSKKKTLLDSAPPLLDFGPGWPRPPKSWMNGCSDEIGFAEPLFLAEKNVYCPDEEEIKALEDYVWKLLYGKLQYRDTYAVKRWIWDDPPPGTDRSFNYPHVFNIYHSMYKIAKLYNLTEHSAKEYLLLAYHTAMTYHSDEYCGRAWRTLGNMGAWNVLNIIESLKDEGLINEYEALLERFKISTEHFIKTKHPYLSEFPYDTTGYESTYFFRKFEGRTDLVNETVKVLLATVHHQPIWWWCGCDIKSLGVYTTAMNSRCLLDAYEENLDNKLLLRIGYTGTLAYWSQVYPSGEACTGPSWSPDGSPGSYFDPAWSNEFGIGLYPNLFALKAYLVEDPDFGLIGYGCDVYETDDSYGIIPADGICFRAFFAPLKINIEVLKSRIEKIEANKEGEEISIDVSKVISSVETVTLKAKGLKPGRYNISTAEGFNKTVNCDSGILEAEVPVSEEKINIRITLAKE